MIVSSLWSNFRLLQCKRSQSWPNVCVLCSMANLTPTMLTGLCTMPEQDECRNVFSPVADMYALILCVSWFRIRKKEL